MMASKNNVVSTTALRPTHERKKQYKPLIKSTSMYSVLSLTLFFGALCTFGGLCEVQNEVIPNHFSNILKDYCQFDLGNIVYK